MGMKRNIDSGRVDSLGRPIKVSGDKGDLDSDAKMGQISDYGDVDIDGKWDIDSMDYDNALDIVRGYEDAPDEVIAELKRLRSEYIDSLHPQDLDDILYECVSWDGSLEEVYFQTKDDYIAYSCGDDAKALEEANKIGDDEYVREGEGGQLETLSTNQHFSQLFERRHEIYDTWEELSMGAPSHYFFSGFKWK